MCTRVQVPEEASGVGSPGAGVTGVCERPDVGNWVL